MTGKWGTLLGLALSASACASVTVYQPLVGLQRPVAIDPRFANFEGLRLELHCVPGDALDEKEAEQLCKNLGTLFTNQGAIVETRTRLGLFADVEGEEEEGPPADLVVELKSRLLHSQNHAALWALPFIPAIMEATYAQDIVIRDANGFLLAKDSLQARFVEYYGVAFWFINWALDLTAREDHDELTSEVVKADFSRDYYGQVSQLLMNANGRWRVLRRAAAEGLD